MSSDLAPTAGRSPGDDECAVDDCRETDDLEPRQTADDETLWLCPIHRQRLNASQQPKVFYHVGGAADGGDRVPDLSPREALERWLGKLRASKAESTVSAYYYQLIHFVRFCEEQNIDPIRALNGWDIETYETRRRQEGLKTISLNKEAHTLKSFLEYCARVELVDESLPEKVAPPDVPKVERVDETRLHTEQARALLDYHETADYASRAHALLALVWYTGARLGAIRGLDLRDYDSDAQLVEFHHRPDEGTPLKNDVDGERAIGLPPAVCDLLDVYIEEHRHDVHDDAGRSPLLTSSVGRPVRNTVRAWMYLATVPCLHTACPHGNDPETCDFLTQTTASQCPSSRSPHQVRTGSITWQLNRGIPTEVVAKRVNTSVRILERHYDQPTKREELEQRRRPHLDRLGFEDDGGDSQ
jgi:site-specific recombinase XerD